MSRVLGRIIGLSPGSVLFVLTCDFLIIIIMIVIIVIIIIISPHSG